ncbi:hypothetical protein [Paenibacillus sp. PL2-23]|uniref:hypothetical protein n=1 Tax=Paenibacillus sp. PL2-23 TaxID=2100729 RepID=UPI0030F82F8D
MTRIAALFHRNIQMAEAGVDLATIMARVGLGHDDPKTTLQMYTHVTKKMKKKCGSKSKKRLHRFAEGYCFARNVTFL